MYEFNIVNTNNRTSPRDPKVRDTVLTFIYDFFQTREAAMLYICETGDRFAEQRELPEIREYDILAIRNAGAYCYSMGGVYNLRAMPAEVVVSGGKVVYVRRRLSSEELCDQILKEGRSL